MALGKLLDYSQARPPLAQVKAAGYSAAYRYVCSDASEAGLKGKRLTPAERDQILAAGLDIGIHGEDEAGAAQKGYARGLAQGKQWADYAAMVLDAPPGMTIVAAIDYDTGGTYPPVVADYLHGVRDGLQGEYAVGVYGSIYVVDAALAAGDAVHGVQTIAWSNGKVSTWAHVYQHGGSEFPGTDYNDVFRVPHGTWLQTLGGDSMSAAEVDEIKSAIAAATADLKQFIRDTVKQYVPRGVLMALTGGKNAVYSAADFGPAVTALADYSQFTKNPPLPALAKNVADLAAAQLTADEFVQQVMPVLGPAVTQAVKDAGGVVTQGTVEDAIRTVFAPIVTPPA